GPRFALAPISGCSASCAASEGETGARWCARNVNRRNYLVRFRVFATAEGVADAGGRLVLLVGDRALQLLAERHLDFVRLAQRILQLPQLLHQRVLLHLVFKAVLGEAA